MSRSQSLFKAAKERIPGGVNSPVRAFQNVGIDPLFIASASKSHLTDVDGRDYIDFVSSWGPLLFGHAHPRVVEAVGRTHVVRRDRWLQVQLAELRAAAPPDVQREIDKAVAARLGVVEKKSIADLRRFLDCFGSLPAADAVRRGPAASISALINLACGASAAGSVSVAGRRRGSAGRRP